MAYDTVPIGIILPHLLFFKETRKYCKSAFNDPSERRVKELGTKTLGQANTTDASVILPT